jgi:hypothetical protein
MQLEGNSHLIRGKIFSCLVVEKQMRILGIMEMLLQSSWRERRAAEMRILALERRNLFPSSVVLTSNFEPLTIVS